MNELGNSLRKLLDRHGYGFQYAILRLAQDLCNKGKSRWLFEAAEFPVEVQGKGTRIDFILRPRGSRLFMLAECKRADPRFSDWCFCRAPYVRRNQSFDKCILEVVHRDGQVVAAGAKEMGALTPDRAYHVAVCLKTQGKAGEGGQSGRDAIEEAASQACRGLNGMVELLSSDRYGGRTGAVFLPVVFTTANIWATTVDLGSADIVDGKLKEPLPELERKDWVYYQYHLSPGLKHSVIPETHADEFSDILYGEYIRTIIVVSSTAVETFLQKVSFDPDFGDLSLP